MKLVYPLLEEATLIFFIDLTYCIVKIKDKITSKLPKTIMFALKHVNHFIVHT